LSGGHVVIKFRSKYIVTIKLTTTGVRGGLNLLRRFCLSSITDKTFAGLAYIYE